MTCPCNVPCRMCGTDRDETPGTPQASPASPRAEHIAVPICDLFTSGTPTSGSFPRSFLVNADWVRIETDFPVIVALDGAPIGNVDAVVWKNNDTNKLPAAVPWNVPANTALHGGFSYTVRRKVEKITIELAPVFNTTEQVVKSIPGMVHVYYGAGSVVDVGPGRWQHGTWRSTITPIAGIVHQFGPIDFISHRKVVGFSGAQREGTPGINTLAFPTEVELLSLGFGAPSNFPYMWYARIFYVDELNRESDIWNGALQQLLTQPVYHQEMATPLRLPVWGQIDRGAVTNGGWFLEFLLSGAHQWDAATAWVNYRWR